MRKIGSPNNIVQYVNRVPHNTEGGIYFTQELVCEHRGADSVPENGETFSFDSRYFMVDRVRSSPVYEQCGGLKSQIFTVEMSECTGKRT